MGNKASSVSTPKGIVPGFSLIDPVTGLPIVFPLQVDTEITLDGITIDNIMIGSMDGSHLNAGILVDGDWHPQIDVLSVPHDPLTAADIVTIDNMIPAVETGLAKETTLDDIKTAVEKIDDAISDSEMQCDVVSLPADVDIRSLNATDDVVKVEGGNSSDVKVSLDNEVVGVSPVGSDNSYFEDQDGTALTGVFAEQDFGFDSFSIMLANDEVVAGGYVEFSFDGINVHGRVLPGEARTMDFRKQGSIYLRGQAGDEDYRIETY